MAGPIQCPADAANERVPYAVLLAREPDRGARDDPATALRRRVFSVRSADHTSRKRRPGGRRLRRPVCRVPGTSRPRAAGEVALGDGDEGGRRRRCASPGRTGHRCRDPRSRARSGRRNPVRDEVVQHRGGFVIRVGAVVAGDEDDLHPARVEQGLGDVEAVGEDRATAACRGSDRHRRRGRRARAGRPTTACDRPTSPAIQTFDPTGGTGAGRPWR